MTKCRIGWHKWYYYEDKRRAYNRGCKTCGKIQMEWGRGWHDWAKGWTLKKALAYDKANSLEEKRQVLNSRWEQVK